MPKQTKLLSVSEKVLQDFPENERDKEAVYTVTEEITMRILKITEQIKDNMLIVSLPEEFNRKKVEVIIIPLKEKKRKFKSLDIISINTEGLDFDRDELHSR